MMTAADSYLIELQRAFAQDHKQPQERLPEKRPIATRIAGGCLLYQFPIRRNGHH